MAIETINDNEQGSDVRKKLNDMFTELYNFCSSIFWTRNGSTIDTVDGVKNINMEENSQGLTMLLLKNTNDVDNYAGAVIAVKGSGEDYTNNVYFGKYGNGFYITSWAGNGVLATDKNLVIAAVGATSKINFQVGGGYTDPKNVLSIENNGVVRSSIVNYETLLTDDNDIPNKKYIDDEIAELLTLINS